MAVMLLASTPAAAQFDLFIDGNRVATMTHLDYELGPGEIHIFTEDLLFDCERGSALEIDALTVFVDEVLVGTLELLEYHLSEKEIHVMTNEQVTGCRKGRIFRGRFEERGDD